ncbi:hypothetical protein LACFE_CDS1670 [Limosilactobacillus fermentum]|uniref:Uncharacterized protein n=1 Tax=Limosilactobacillus fermentum TaxID=1613 RepID=A0A1D7ZZ35_LIMFE|nr:hypothetical protein LACFE_CDS1670 [Limosilactobacillus fermentum]
MQNHYFSRHQFNWLMAMVLQFHSTIVLFDEFLTSSISSPSKKCMSLYCFSVSIND